MDDLAAYFKDIAEVDSDICECGHARFQHYHDGHCTVRADSSMDLYADNCIDFRPRRVLGKVSA